MFLSPAIVGILGALGLPQGESDQCTSVGDSSAARLVDQATNRSSILPRPPSLPGVGPWPGLGPQPQNHAPPPLPWGVRGAQVPYMQGARLDHSPEVAALVHDVGVVDFQVKAGFIPDDRGGGFYPPVRLAGVIPGLLPAPPPLLLPDQPFSAEEKRGREKGAYSNVHRHMCILQQPKAPSSLGYDPIILQVSPFKMNVPRRTRSRQLFMPT